MNVEDIFIKDTEPEPKENLDIQIVEKPKRKLTDKQKQALQEGRRKAKAKRDNEKKQKQKELKTSQELKKEQRDLKKKLTKRQQEALEKVQARQNRKKTLDAWDETKSKVLETMPDEGSFITLNNYLDTLTDEDVLNEQKLKYKLAVFAKHLHERKN
tara:strand:- start:360 stop:830 length:471 start_codon:yes stop_codon:yes gene_type:complete